MTTRTIRTHVMAIVLGITAATGFRLSAQSPAGADEQIKKLETRIAALEQQIKSRGPLTVTEPFIVQDKKGNGILIVGGEGNAVDLRVGGNGGSVSLTTSDHVGIVTAFAPGAANVNLVSARDEAGISVYKGGGDKRDPNARFPVAFFGSTDDVKDATGVLTVNNAMGEPVGIFSARATGGNVLVTDPTGKNVAAELAVTAEGGRLRVSDKAGAAVGGLFANTKGGGLALTGPGGGYSAVSLGINKGGGSVRVFSATGGTARAALEADAATGGVTAYDQKGSPAATLASTTGGSGILQLLSGGTTMVEAGSTEDGLGLVRAGPSTRGVIGTIIPPHTLLGRKQ